MRSPDDATSILHMTEAAEKIVRFTVGRQRNDLEADEQLNLSLVRLLEIIGEAATRISQGTRESNAGIPWTQMIGMRNRLIHGYDVVDSDVLWQTVTGDIPELLSRLRRVEIVPSSAEKDSEGTNSEV